MKALLVNKFLHPNGGSETYMFKLGEELSRLGHEVQYFGMEHEKRCVGNALNAYTSNMDFHSGKRFSKIWYPFKTIYSWEARKKIRCVLDDFQPDVVHLNNFNYQLTPSIIVEIKKWRKEAKHQCTIVYTAHDYQLICPNHMLYNPTEQAICEKCLGNQFANCVRGKCIHGSIAKSIIGALEGYLWKIKGIYKELDAIICPTDFMKRKMDTTSVFAARTVVMLNFVDDMEWKQSQKKDYILYFGRFSEEKGIKTLISACKALPAIPFLFAGTGPLGKELEGIANITSVGFQTGTALEELIREALFSVYPSEWYENCPFSVMESQMYGTPVLGADIGGIPEVIQAGRTGELFESGNAQALIAVLAKLYDDKERAKRYGDNCKALSFDTVEQYCEKLLGIYQA